MATVINPIYIPKDTRGQEIGEGLTTASKFVSNLIGTYKKREYEQSIRGNIAKIVEGADAETDPATLAANFLQSGLEPEQSRLLSQYVVDKRREQRDLRSWEGIYPAVAVRTGLPAEVLRNPTFFNQVIQPLLAEGRAYKKDIQTEEDRAFMDTFLTRNKERLSSTYGFTPEAADSLTQSILTEMRNDYNARLAERQEKRLETAATKAELSQPIKDWLAANGLDATPYNIDKAREALKIEAPTAMEREAYARTKGTERAKEDLPITPEDALRYVSKKTYKHPSSDETLGGVKRSKEYAIVSPQAAPALTQARVAKISFDKMREIVYSRPDLFPRETGDTARDGRSIAAARFKFTALRKARMEGQAAGDPAIAAIDSFKLIGTILARLFGDVGMVSDIQQELSNAAAGFENGASQQWALGKIQTVLDLSNGILESNGLAPFEFVDPPNAEYVTDKKSGKLIRVR